MKHRVTFGGGCAYMYDSGLSSRKEINVEHQTLSESKVRRSWGAIRKCKVKESIINMYDSILPSSDQEDFASAPPDSKFSKQISSGTFL
ncbi:hypothetical protein MHBO_004187 [Bonamia ostreae]|uniref:Uncharacterized protein n=1 Tax=Bonamia ostreae TaxID=126728 RepID=A0ABV2ASM2_9EUKA